MPLYDFCCPSCDAAFEKSVSYQERDFQRCPDCNGSLIWIPESA